jgi:hypothetical protein
MSRWAASSRKYATRTRSEILALLGGVCVRCGFNDERALQFDHIHGGGTRHRVVMSRSRRYAYMKANPHEFQLLCANCNWIKRSESFYERGGKPTWVDGPLNRWVDHPLNDAVPVPHDA